MNLKLQLKNVKVSDYYNDGETEQHLLVTNQDTEETRDFGGICEMWQKLLFTPGTKTSYVREAYRSTGPGVKDATLIVFHGKPYANGSGEADVNLAIIKNGEVTGALIGVHNTPNSYPENLGVFFPHGMMLSLFVRPVPKPRVKKAVEIPTTAATRRARRNRRG